MSAAEALVAELSKSAAGGGKGIDGGDGQGQQQQQQQADALRSYALRRLVRGLASPRGAARQGFATALSAVLLASSEGGDKGVAVALKVLDTIDAELPSSSAAASGAAEHGPSSSNNARDASLGRVFALAAVARSGACARSAEISSRVAEALAEVALRGKSYSREAAAAALAGVAGLLSAEGLSAAASVPKSGGGGGALAAIFNSRDVEASDDDGGGQEEEVGSRKWAPLPSNPVAASPEAALVALRLWPRLPASFDCSRCAFLPREEGAPRLAFLEAAVY